MQTAGKPSFRDAKSAYTFGGAKRQTNEWARLCSESWSALPAQHPSAVVPPRHQYFFRVSNAAKMTQPWPTTVKACGVWVVGWAVLSNLRHHGAGGAIRIDHMMFSTFAQHGETTLLATANFLPGGAVALI